MPPAFKIDFYFQKLQLSTPDAKGLMPKGIAARAEPVAAGRPWSAFFNALADSARLRKCRKYCELNHIKPEICLFCSEFAVFTRKFQKFRENSFDQNRF